MLRRSSEGGIGTSDGLATQNIDPNLMNSTVTSGGVAGHYNSTSIASGMSPGHPGMTGTGSSRRAYSSMSGRYPRSWHPSPYGSEDDASSDEPQFYKEEKKNRIKMEIARRRQQIEENACLHDELTRLAKLRETAEISDRLNVMPTNAYGTGTPMSPAIMAAAAAAGTAVGNHVTGISNLAGTAGVGNHVTGGLGTLGTAVGNHSGLSNHVSGLSNHVTGLSSLGTGIGTVGNHVATGTGAVTGTGTSVLKSVDEILRSSTDPMAAAHALTGGTTSDLYHHHPTTTSTYGLGDHRVTDFSPINSDMIDRSVYRSSSADPTLGTSGYGSNYMTSTVGDPYGTAGGKYSKYGTMTGTMAAGGTGVTSSSLYRKY